MSSSTPRPWIPAPGCCRVDVITLWYSAVYMYNVFNVHKGSDFTQADCITLRGVIDAWDNASFKNARANQSSLVRIRTRALHVQSGPGEDYALPTPRVGTWGGSTPYPPNATICVSLRTGIIGRANRGRVYMPGLNNGMGGPGDISTSYATGLINVFTDLISRLNTAGTPLVILSYRLNREWRTTANPVPVTQAILVDNHIDSQRRRLIGRGI